MKYLLIALLWLSMASPGLSRQKMVSLCPTSGGIDFCEKLEELRDATNAEVQRIKSKEESKRSNFDKLTYDGYKKGEASLEKLITILGSRVTKANKTLILSLAAIVRQHNYIARKGAYKDKDLANVIPELQRIINAQNLDVPVPPQNPVDTTQILKELNKQLSDSLKTAKSTNANLILENKKLKENNGGAEGFSGICPTIMMAINTALLLLVLLLIIVPRIRRQQKKREAPKVKKEDSPPVNDFFTKPSSPQKPKESEKKAIPNQQHEEMSTPEETTFFSDRGTEEDQDQITPDKINMQDEPSEQSDTVDRQEQPPKKIRYASSFIKGENGFKEKDVKAKRSRTSMYEVTATEGNQYHLRPIASEAVTQNIRSDIKNNLEALFHIRNKAEIDEVAIITATKPAILEKKANFYTLKSPGEI